MTVCSRLFGINYSKVERIKYFRLCYLCLLLFYVNYPLILFYAATIIVISYIDAGQIEATKIYVLILILIIE